MNEMTPQRLTNQRPLSTVNRQAIFPFPLDDFQTKALEALGQRENVVVSAPTGSGTYAYTYDVSPVCRVD